MNGTLIVKLSSCRMRYTLQFMKSAAVLADRRALKLPRISLCAPSDFILATTLMTHQDQVMTQTVLTNVNNKSRIL